MEDVLIPPPPFISPTPLLSLDLSLPFSHSLPTCLDWLDDVELVGISPGCWCYSSPLWWFSILTHPQCTLGLCRQLWVSLCRQGIARSFHHLFPPAFINIYLVIALMIQSCVASFTTLTKSCATCTSLVAIYFSETSSICPVWLAQIQYRWILKFIICFHFQVTPL